MTDIIKDKPALVKGTSLWKDGLRRLLRRKFAMVCLVVILAYFAVTAFVYVAEFFNWQVGAVMWA